MTTAIVGEGDTGEFVPFADVAAVIADLGFLGAPRVRIPAGQLVVGDVLPFARATVIAVEARPYNRLFVQVQRGRPPVAGDVIDHLWRTTTPVWVIR